MSRYIGCFIGSPADATIIRPVAKALGDRALLIEQPYVPVDDHFSDAHDAAMRGAAAVRSAWGARQMSCIVIAGDRPEALAAAVAATIRHIPIVHLHGGEVTEGAIDNKIRYAISALASLHCVSLPCYKDTLVGMRYSERDIFVTGAPSLDGLVSYKPRDPGIGQPFVLVSYYPATQGESPAEGMREVLRLVGDRHVVYSAPNTDAGFSQIEFPAHWQPHTRGDQSAWWNLLAYCDEAVGNSSSFIYDAAVMGTPVQIVGRRQEGRKRIEHTIQTAPLRIPRPCEACDGHAAERIAKLIRDRHP